MHSTLNLSVDAMGMAMFSEAASGATAGKALGNTTSDGVTRYRILMLSEGIHNGLRVLRDDIQQMIYNAQINPTTVIPVVLDHSFNWNDVVGKIDNVEYYDTYAMPDGKQITGAAIADIELLPPSENTPKLNESLYRMEKLPELAKFSVAFKFTPITDNIGNTTVKELELKHVAIVTNPADPSTGIIEKFSRHDSAEQFCHIDMTGVFARGNTMPPKSTKSTRTARYARRGARFNNPAVETIARNALPYSGTYPIRDVSSVVMRPGQLSPLGCGCGEELYERQAREDMPVAAEEFAGRRARLSSAQRARLARKAKLARAKKAAKLAAARPSARFGRSAPSARRGARFTQYGVPTVYGNPWDLPVSDTYPNVNQLIALKRNAAKLAARKQARLSARKAARLAHRGARFDDEFEINEYPTYEDGTPVVIQDEFAPAYEDIAVPTEPILGAPIVNQPIVMDQPVDPVIEAYIEAGLIAPEEVEIVEATLAQCRASARKAKFAKRSSSARKAKFSGRRPAARKAKFAGRKAKFDDGGLINDYLVPSANLPRKQNINVREEPVAEAAAFDSRRARLAKARRSGSFFANRGVEKGKLNQQEQPPVPVQSTSIAPTNNAANTEPQTFVGGNTEKLLKELADAKAALAESEQLSMLRAQALSMKMADKDFVMTLSENQLKRYIQTNGINTDSLAGTANPFASSGANEAAKAKYIAEFADSFTKGSVTPLAATIEQINTNSMKKAEQLFGAD